MVASVLTACGPGSGSTDDGGGSGSGGSGTSDGSGGTASASASSGTASATATAGSSTDESNSSSDGGCGPNPCDACEPGCIDDTQCVDGQWSCGCVCDTQCPDHPESDFAHGGKTEPIDCGALGAADALEAWQALHDCVVGQAAAQGAFWASWDTEDGTGRIGIAGAVGETYAAAYFDIIAGGDTIQYGCSGFAATPDCSVAPFAPCVTCLDMDEGHTACLGPK